MNRDSTQWPVMPSRLDTGAYIQGDRRKERLHLSHPYFIFMTRSQNTSTTRKRAKTYRTTSSSGPLWENVVARITIDDETGHIMSLEYTKHMTEKELHRNLPSIRAIRTVLLHFSPVTPNQQLKQSFQTFAALPVDETTQQTSQIQTAVHDELSVGSERIQIPHFVSCES